MNFARLAVQPLLSTVLVGALASGCGVLLADRCESLCADVSIAIDDCMTASMDWTDFGARTRQEFVSECRQEWDRTSNDLSSRDLELALEVCEETREEVPTWSCDEVMALYGPDE